MAGTDQACPRERRGCLCSCALYATRPSENTGRPGSSQRDETSAEIDTPGLRLHKKGKGSPYSIAERRVPELIPVLGSQPAGDVSHKHGGRLPLLSARHAVTPATLKRAATNFAAW